MAIGVPRSQDEVMPYVGDIVKSTVNDTTGRVVRVELAPGTTAGVRLTVRKLTGKRGWCKRGDEFPESPNLCTILWREPWR